MYLKITFNWLLLGNKKIRWFSMSRQENLFTLDFQGLSLHRGSPVLSARLFMFREIYSTSRLSKGKMFNVREENLMLGSVTKCRT